MATLVLVHGINQQYKSTDELEAAWRPSIAGGIREAGNSQLADKLMRGEISMRMAFYGSRFRSNAQGGGARFSQLEGDPIAEALAQEWLIRATQSTRLRLSQAAKRELRAVAETDAARQGVGSFARSAIAALSHVPFLADKGTSFASTFLWSALSQVTAYFENTKLREEIIEGVCSHVTTETRVLIGHSLGSVVAFEAAHRIDFNLRLLATLGSPIGLRNVIYDRLRPSPPSFPQLVERWINIADREDFVAAVSDLRPMIRMTDSLAPAFENHLVVNGARPHDVGPYLNSPILGRAITAALS